MKDNKKITKALKSLSEAINRYADAIPQPQVQSGAGWIIPDNVKKEIEKLSKESRFDSHGRLYDFDMPRRENYWGHPHKENPMVDEEEKMREEELRKFFKKDEPELKVGQWYKRAMGTLICFCGFGESAYVDKIVQGYGFSAKGKFHEDRETGWGGYTNEWTPATDKEVEEALIKETRERYKEGDIVSKCLYWSDENTEIHGWFTAEVKDEDGECCVWDNHQICIFRDGQWAEIISQPEEKPSKHYVDMRVLHELSDNELYSVLHTISEEVIKRKK